MCKVCGKTRTEVIPKKASAESNKENVKPEKDEEVKDDKGTAMYEIADVSRKEVAYKAPANRNATKITIPAKVSKIGKQAFYGCKKLKTITIRTSKLTSKKVGNKAFKGIHAKATVKVPKKKLTSYKRILKAKGVGSKVKIKK